MLKSTESFGSLKREKVIQEVYVLQNNYVVNVNIDLNVLNGVFNTKDSASGVDLPPDKEKLYAENVT